MLKLIHLFLLFVGAIHLVSCQTITCYDCDPLNFASDCGDPVGTAVRTSPCSIDPDVVNGTAICVSAYLNVTGGTTNLTGIYRGCRTLPPDVRDYCDWFGQERQGFNTTVLSCEACNTTRCNIIGFRDDGSSGAPNIFASAALVLIFNVLLVILFSGRE